MQAMPGGAGLFPEHIFGNPAQINHDGGVVPVAHEHVA
jgi:hypothetical protein